MSIYYKYKYGYNFKPSSASDWNSVGLNSNFQVTSAYTDLGLPMTGIALRSVYIRYGNKNNTNYGNYTAVATRTGHRNTEAYRAIKIVDQGDGPSSNEVLYLNGSYNFSTLTWSDSYTPHDNDRLYLLALPGFTEIEEDGGNISYQLPNESITGYSLKWRTGDYYVDPGWYLYQPSDTSDVYWSTYYTPNKYTVTLDPRGGTGGTSSVTATYDSAMPSAIMPTKTGYTFAGYYSETDGGGTKYYNADGTSAHDWDKANNNTTLYAYWVVRIKIKSAGHGTANLVSGSKSVSSTDLTDNNYLDLNEDDEFTVSGTADTGYVLGKWSVNGVDIQSSTITATATTNATYIAYFVDYYTVTWDCNIPNKFDVKATPYGNYPNSQNPERNKFYPNSSVRFDLSMDCEGMVETTTFQGYPLYKYNNEFYTINNWGWENGTSYNVHYDYYNETINRSGKFMANLYSGELTTYTLYTNYGKASINGVTATPDHPAQIKLAKTQEYIYLAHELDDKNIKFKYFEDSDGNRISDWSYIADDNTEIYAIFELNGQTCSILVPDTYEAVAEPVYIKDGLVTESNTRFISYKYPEYVDWAEVERITGKKPKIGDFYFMPIERQSKSQQGDI